MKEQAPEVTASVSNARSSRIELREWTVEVAGGPDKGRKVSTLGSLLRVGTDPTNDLVLSDQTVSRRHLELERTVEGLLLRDLGSRNGTLLEGRRVKEAFVEPGDKLTLGKTRLALKEKAHGTEVELDGADFFGELVGASEAMRIVFAELRRAAMVDTSLLLEGETGTGKELAARAVHAHSARKNSPFRVLDCNLLTEKLADRELFGDASRGHVGLFESAQGGTLFLDEVGELPPTLQPKLLRVLDSREFTPLGATAPVQLDVRIVSSTHRNLDEEVRLGNFRSDLYFRLAVARVRLPPLRTRREDLPLLVRHLSRLAKAPELSPQTLSLFESYDWPGNVRELRNVLERAMLAQETGENSWLDFLAHSPPEGNAPRGRSVLSMAAELPYHEAKDRVLGDFERIYFAEVMKLCGFDMARAEEKTGLSMQSLYRLLKKNGLRMKDLKHADG